MKLKLSIYFLVLLLCGFKTNSSTRADQVDFLKKHAQEIKTINYKDNNLSSLEYLRDKIGDARIVMLGEHKHTDSTANEAKLKVINYLYREMGFEVLILEERMYNLFRTMENINYGDSPLVSYIKSSRKGYLYEAEFTFWKMIHELNSSQDKLVLEGLDLTDSKYFVEDLKEFLVNIDSNVIKHSLWHTFQTLSKTMLPAEKNPTVETLQEYTNSAEYIVEFIKVKTKEGVIGEKESSRWLQLLKVAIGTKKWYVYRPEKFKNKMGFSFHELRDQYMADNLLWLIEQRYPDKKIIVSTSTYHMTRNVKYIKSRKKDITETKPMGEYIWEKHQSEIYSLAFIEYTGETADSKKPKTVYKKKKESIEAMLHDTGFKYALLDLKSLSKTEEGAWLGGEFIMSPTFMKPNLTAKWVNLYDGFFYCDVVTPNNYKRVSTAIQKEAGTYE